MDKLTEYGLKPEKCSRDFHAAMLLTAATLAFHVSPGKMPMGLFMYNSGVMMSSVDGFKITGRPRGEVPAHDPKVRFNEDVCAIGPAGLAHCAHMA